MLEGGSHDAWLRLMHETAMERTGVLRRENNPVVSGSEHDGSELIGLVCPPLDPSFERGTTPQIRSSLESRWNGGLHMSEMPVIRRVCQFRSL